MFFRNAEKDRYLYLRINLGCRDEGARLVRGGFRGVETGFVGVVFMGFADVEGYSPLDLIGTHGLLVQDKLRDASAIDTNDAVCQRDE